MRKIATFLLILLSSIVTMQAQNIENIIKDLKYEQRLDTLIYFDQTNDLEYIPLTIIKGNEADPIFTIVAGIHGFEYPPIVAVQEIMNNVEPQKLKGTLIFIPIANVASFYGRSPFVNPLDNKNLNTTFPGSPKGSISEKIAHWITTQIIPVSDVFLDIHGGDASEDLIPFICYYDNKDENTQKAHNLSEASNMEYIVSYPYNITKTEPAKYAFKQAVQDDKVALSIEAGKLGTVQAQNVELIKDAVENMLTYMDMYSFEKIKNETTKKYLKNQAYIKTPTRGIFYSSVKSGDQVIKNQNIGCISDHFGNVLENIFAPVDGIVLYKVGTPPVNPGETLFCIAY